MNDKIEIVGYVARDRLLGFPDVPHMVDAQGEFMWGDK